MKIQIRYFASVREQLGPTETVTLGTPDSGASPRTVGELQAWLAARSPAHAAALDPARGLRTAYDQELCAADQALADGAEVAFFPPVTGG
ncbi:MAG: MoaD/ThiS family protein [Aquabacterium sp.]